MKKFKRTLAAVVGIALLAQPVLADCAAPKLASEALLCQADQIRARRAGTVIGGALAGALIGNLLTQGGGGDKTRATVAGALAGGLAGYWLSVSNEIKAKKASDAARASEVKSRAVRDAKAQKTQAAALKSELKVALLRSPSTNEDAKKREEHLASIAKAAQLGAQNAQDSGNGYTNVAADLGSSYDARPGFASTAASYQDIKAKACAGMTRPGNYCS